MTSARELQRKRKKRQEGGGERQHWYLWWIYVVRRDVGEKRCFGGNRASFYFFKNRMGVKGQLNVFYNRKTAWFLTWTDISK